MNSKQRRQEKRKFKHEIKLPHEYWHYSDIHGKINRWLNTNTAGEYKLNGISAARFAKEQDAIMFALTFSGYSAQ